MPVMTFVSNLNYVAIGCDRRHPGPRLEACLSVTCSAFIQYSRSFTQPITQMASIMNLLQSTMASAERVFELLDEPEELADVKEPQVLDTPRPRPHIRDVGSGTSPRRP